MYEIKKNGYVPTNHTMNLCEPQNDNLNKAVALAVRKIYADGENCETSVVERVIR